MEFGVGGRIRVRIRERSWGFRVRVTGRVTATVRDEIRVRARVEVRNVLGVRIG